MQWRKRNGFTLIEAIIVIVIIGLVTVVASKPLSEGYKSYQYTKNIIYADWQYRYALERMARDLRSVNSATAITTATATTITFLNSSGTTITYDLSSSQITRQTTGSPQTLAEGITNSTLFDYYDSSGTLMTLPVTVGNIRYIKINLTGNISNVTYSLSTTVFTRFAS